MSEKLFDHYVIEDYQFLSDTNIKGIHTRDLHSQWICVSTQKMVGGWWMWKRDPMVTPTLRNFLSRPITPPLYLEVQEISAHKLSFETHILWHPLGQNSEVREGNHTMIQNIWFICFGKTKRKSEPYSKPRKTIYLEKKKRLY